jgi:thymidylate kinase
MAMPRGSVPYAPEEPDVGDVIFVEGVPGAGKSTTAQLLARQLAFHGRPARWIYEEEAPNPFVPEMPAAGFRTWEDFGEAHVERWRAFAREIAVAPETVIVESFLLQRPVFTMLRRDASPTIIEALVNRFATTVAALRPRLVHLFHSDPERAWRAVAAKRGAAYVAGTVERSAEWPFIQSRGLAGLDGVLAYWRAHAALCDAMVSWLPMETFVVDVTAGGWSERREQLCKLLGIPADEPPPPDPASLAPLAGRYRSGDQEITIDLEEGRLVLRGVLWPSNALLPVTPTVFDVEAWPLRVSFDEARDGGPRALRWHGSRMWWGGPTGVYARVE